MKRLVLIAVFLFSLVLLSVPVLCLDAGRTLLALRQAEAVNARQRERISAYYAAETELERALMQVDTALSLGESPTDSPLVHREGNTLVVTVRLDTGETLVARVELAAASTGKRYHRSGAVLVPTAD